ncbi:MAG TPA: hypothetical protein VMG08_09680 [Allosphingosinicella sp.]|nr:hypothetical protein [Allosphingosinicella sp.]
MRPVKRTWLRRISLWLSLAIVLTCALGSFGSPARATSGSAFNAFTSDVSLGPQRASAPEKDRQEQTPASGGTGQAKALPAATLIPAAALPAAIPSASDPALPRPVFSIAGALGARGPPLP